MLPWQEFSEMVMAVLLIPFMYIALYIGPDAVAGVIVGYMGLLVLSVYYD